MEQLEKVKLLDDLSDHSGCFAVSSQSRVSLLRSTSGASRPSGNRVLEPFERSASLCSEHFDRSGQKWFHQNLVGDSSCLASFSVQRRATPLGPPEASDGEVSTVWEGERPSVTRNLCPLKCRRRDSKLTEPLATNRDFSRSSRSTAKRLSPSAARGANRR